MKRVIILALLIFSFQFSIISSINAAPVRNMPIARIQPNGDTLHCFVSGDEYYQRLHDANGYTIVQNSTNGWYVYADRAWNADHTDWEVVPTNHIVGSVNPASLGLSPNIIASPATVAARREAWEVPAASRLQAPSGSKALTSRNRGTINNIVIFIRFSDDDEISTPFSTIENMFNDSSANAISMHNYFWRASYSQLRIPTYFYPTPNGDSVISYQSTYPRSYYMPFNETTNPNGYTSDDGRRNREFSLIEAAVNYVNSLNIIPSDLQLDMDNDGTIDNICFIVKGTYTGWSELLWPHKWSLYDRYVYLNGKRVYTFNLQLEGSGSHYFSTSTFCHEMFHTLGAPDLYHYQYYDNVSSVGSWDLMCSNTTPPQHMGMYMKMQYGKWIDTIPEITEAGTYILNSVGDSIHTNNQCYRIMSADGSQWYMLEYRDNTELFETGLGGRGLLIYRIDSRFNGGANFDGVSSFDEVYIFRPGGINDTTPGHISQAFFSEGCGRTAFSSTTNPSPWLTGNIADTTIEISNITAAGNTISFTYTPHRPAVPDCGDSACTVTVEMQDQYGDTWNGGYLSFENAAGQCLATVSMGDGCSRENKTLRFCREPIIVNWNGGVSPNECGFKIRLGDNSIWKNVSHAYGSANVGTIMDPCEQYVPPQCTITVQSNDTACRVTGSGLVEQGTQHTINAVMNGSHNFIGWHDGPYNGPEDDNDISSTDHRRTITVMQDSLFTAIYEPIRYTVKVTTATNQSDFGTVSVDAGDYGTSSSELDVPYGTQVTLLATPNEGYLFDYWRKNYNTDQILDNPLTVTITSNVTYRAFFHSTNPQGINDASQPIIVYTTGNQLTIDGAQGRRFEVFNTLGQSVFAGTLTSPLSRHLLPAPGIYIVRIEGHKAIKVISE